MKIFSVVVVLAFGLSFSVAGNAKEVVDRELVAKILLLGEPLGSSSGGNRYPDSTMIAIRYNNMVKSTLNQENRFFPINQPFIKDYQLFFNRWV